jgi:hypothetical protein
VKTFLLALSSFWERKGTMNNFEPPNFLLIIFNFFSFNLDQLDDQPLKAGAKVSPFNSNQQAFLKKN